MSEFKTNLEKLPSIDNIKSLTLKNDLGETVTVIENKPGKSGSLAVYHHLYKIYGKIGSEAANEGLVLFGEYTQEAKNAEGSHPNIDLLFKIINNDLNYTAVLE